MWPVCRCCDFNRDGYRGEHKQTAVNRRATGPRYSDDTQARGLLTSTLAEFLIRPALFWTFIRSAAKRSATDRLDNSELTQA
jgi:hypothetical protein